MTAEKLLWEQRSFCESKEKVQTKTCQQKDKTNIVLHIDYKWELVSQSILCQVIAVLCV